MLVTMKEILDVANEQNYAVAAPNVISEIDGRAALETAEDLNAPLILDISWRGTMDLEFVGSYMTRPPYRSRSIWTTARISRSASTPSVPASPR